MGTMRLRRNAAIYTAKAAAKFIRKTGKGHGDTLPGRIARFIYPNILTELSREVREKIIVTTGTNGKTTANSITYHALKREGKRVIINKTGSNMINGITSAFVLATGKKGMIDADYACIEVDELAAAEVFPELKPDIAILTNISRDQLDRFGEVDITCSRIKSALASIPNTTLIVNCDDAISYSMALECQNPLITYGINEQLFDEISCSETRASTFCKVCGKKLSYEFFHYGHLGIYMCPSCGFARPMPDYAANGITRTNEMYSFNISSFPAVSGSSVSNLSAAETYETGRTVKTEFIHEHFTNASIHISEVPLRFSYNIYNILCVYAALCTAGALRSKFAESAADFDYANGREGVFALCSAQVQLHLAKNPVGFQQKISYILQDKTPKDIIIQINDTYQDGKDISWLWDVDFAKLAVSNVANIYAAGSRRFDMGLRLKYENISCRFTSDIGETVKDLAVHASQNIYIVVNYSGLYKTYKLLSDMQDTQNSGKTNCGQAPECEKSPPQSYSKISCTKCRHSGKDISNMRYRRKRIMRIKRFFREIVTKEA